MSSLRQACAEFIASRTESGNDCHVIAYMEQTRTGLAMGRLLGTPMSVPHERVVRAIAVALDDERRQTQRRMIAALYWRAGVAAHLADVSCVFGEQRGYTSMRNALIFAARAMEAACPR